MEKSIMTVAEFAKVNGLDKLEAGGFTNVLVSKGIVKKVGSRKVDGARGKPSNLFEYPSEISMSLKAVEVVTKVEAVAEVAAETAVTESKVVENVEAVG